ncbi:MAG: hypothetical protein Q9181_005572 [Wetmoreana brouardii]
MPGMGIDTSTEHALPPDLSLLRRHKSLPKRRIVSPNDRGIPVVVAKERVHDLEREGYSSSERIRSWIPEPSSVQAVPEHGLPLTPPLNASERPDGFTESESQLDYPPPIRTSIHTASSGITSPVVQRSPPTPETTPPKSNQHAQVSHESSNSHLTSTRAESFETARERQMSTEDVSQQESPSLRPSRQKWLNSAGPDLSKHIGLGLGLESEDGERTPTDVVTRTAPTNDELVSFDGAWNGATPEVEAVKGGAYLAYQAELRKRQPRRPQISDQMLATPPIVDKNTPSPVAPSTSLRQSVDQTRQTPPSASAQDFAKDIQWPLRDDNLNLEEKLREVDNKRSSQISATSTIVEAMVFNTPPRRRKTLRHSSKCADLNSSSKQPKRDSLNVDGTGHRRLLRHLKSPDGGQRASFASGLHGVDGAQPFKRGQDVVPVIVIPERISSLGSKIHCIPYLRRVKSLTPIWQQSPRPTTAPEDPVGYFDTPRPERRIVSAYVSTSPAKEERYNGKKAQPIPAPLDATPSAPLSRNVSGATSRSASVGLDSISPPTRQQSQTSYQVPGTTNAGLTSPDEEINGDWSALRPRSSLVTPFSLRSARSSTPGTLEVNEATAISIYPHTNKSILVVQHASGRNSQPAEHSAIIASNAKFAIPAGSVQPPVIHQPRQLLDSPLQNPRSPPQPPDFKFIPPTPANATDDISSLDRKERPPSEKPPKRRLSVNRVKRAFSARRYSDAFVAPLTRSFSLSRRNTVSDGARRASTGIDLDRNLHPFWRPRAFWDSKDDGSDSDSDFGNNGFLVGNSLGMPTEDVKTVDPPKRRGSLRQRLGSLRLPKRRNSVAVPATTGFRDEFYDGNDIRLAGNLRKANSTRLPSLRHKTATFYRRYKDGNGSYEFIQRPPQRQEHASEHDGVDEGGGGNMGVPRLGYQVQFVGFKGLAEKVKEKREEAKREKMRQRLRGSIDVLRGFEEGKK